MRHHLIDGDDSVRFFAFGGLAGRLLGTDASRFFGGDLGRRELLARLAFGLESLRLEVDSARGVAGGLLSRCPLGFRGGPALGHDALSFEAVEL